jgi:topoisomerase-4 subunit B
VNEGDRTRWSNTTHDWAATVDRAHLDAVRRSPDTYAPTGLLHLVLEVVAYADDEAQALGRPGHCVVTCHADGSVSVADDGRGTDTRRDSNGDVVRKPVMATEDLRFFAPEHGVLLPDGAPRRGMSTVAALSTWLLHTNRRNDGAWTQRYEHGVPTTDLLPTEGTPATGTTVRFRADPQLVTASTLRADDLRDVAAFPSLTVDVRVE